MDGGNHDSRQEPPSRQRTAGNRTDDEFGGEDIDWSSIAVGGVGGASAATAATATETTTLPRATATTAVAAAQRRVPAYNPYGTSASAAGSSGSVRYGGQQQSSASSSVGLTDGAVVMSSGGGGGGIGSSSASGTPPSSYMHGGAAAAPSTSTGTARGGGGWGGGGSGPAAGGSASHAIDLTTTDDPNISRGQQPNLGQAGANAGGSFAVQKEEELRKKVRGQFHSFVLVLFCFVFVAQVSRQSRSIHPNAPACFSTILNAQCVIVQDIINAYLITYDVHPSSQPQPKWQCVAD